MAKVLFYFMHFILGFQNGVLYRGVSPDVLMLEQTGHIQVWELLFYCFSWYPCLSALLLVNLPWSYGRWYCGKWWMHDSHAKNYKICIIYVINYFCTGCSWWTSDLENSFLVREHSQFVGWQIHWLQRLFWEKAMVSLLTGINKTLSKHIDSLLKPHNSSCQ